jgi:protein SCO1/2
MMTLKAKWLRRLSVPAFVTCGTVIFFVSSQPEPSPGSQNTSPETLQETADLSGAGDRLPSTRYPTVTGSRVSDKFGDVELIDQSGTKVSFYSDLVMDRCVCIVFFYTRCEGSCPTTMLTLKRLRHDLSLTFDEEEMVFVALTLEPEVDTPEELQAYMDRYEIKPEEKQAGWVFATGSFEDIEGLRRSLGIYDLDPIIDADKTEHASIVTFGNDRLDRWAALPADMDYKQLLTGMTRTMGNSRSQAFPEAHYRNSDSL